MLLRTCLTLLKVFQRWQYFSNLLRLLNLHFSCFFSIKCNNQITQNHRQRSSWFLSLLFRAHSQTKLQLKGNACTAWRFSPDTLDLEKCRYFFPLYLSLFLSFLLFQSASLFFPILIIHVLICSSLAVEKWQGSVRRPWAMHWRSAMLEGSVWKETLLIGV